MLGAAHLSPIGHGYGKLTALHCGLASHSSSGGAMGPFPVSLGDGTRKASTAQRLGRCPGSAGTAGSEAVTLRRCPSDLGGGPREHVLGKVSFHLTLPGIVEGLPGCWGGGSIRVCAATASLSVRVPI